MNLREFIDTVRLYWKTFAAACVTVLALGIAWLVFTPLQYVSTAQLLVSLNGTSTANAYQNDNVVAGRVNSYVALVTSQPVSQRVVDKLGLKMSSGELAAKVSAVQVPPNTAIIDVAVSDRSPEQARRIAGTVAEEFVAYTQAMESPTGPDAQKVQTTVVNPPSQPRSRLPERVAIGGLIGLLALLAGAVAVWIRSVTDRVVRVPGQAAAAADAPVVGIVSNRVADSVGAVDTYRRLRTNLAKNDIHVVQLSPVDTDIDVDQVAANLATANALAGIRTVVLDATGRHPDRHGLTDATDGSADVFYAPGWAAEPDLAASSAAAGVFEQLRHHYEQVIIATEPITAGSGASVLTDHSDGVVLAVDPGRSRKKAVTRAADELRSVGGTVLGVLATTAL